MKKISGPPATLTGAGSDIEILNLATFRAYLELDAGDTGRNTYLQLVLNNMHRWFYNWSGRVIKKSATPFVYVLEGTGDHELYLPQWPLVTVSSIELGYIEDSSNTFSSLQTLTSIDYHLDNDAGCIYLINGIWGAGVWGRGINSVKVTWTAGYDSAALPDDLLEAFAIWGGVKISRKDDNRWDLASRGLENQAEVFRAEEIPQAQLRVFRSYKRMELGIA